MPLQPFAAVLEVETINIAYFFLKYFGHVGVSQFITAAIF